MSHQINENSPHLLNAFADAREALLSAHEVMDGQGMELSDIQTCLDDLYECETHLRVREVAPNDPKLSDGGGWRAGCMVGGKVAAEAASVTAGAVRCSAWLGVAAVVKKRMSQ